MMTEIKMVMKNRARLIKGLVNVLQSDAEYICSDADDFDLIALGEAIPEVKDTIQRLSDNVAELEYALYLSRK